MQLLSERLQGIAGLEKPLVLMPSASEADHLAAQAEALSISVERFDESLIKQKPWRMKQERWGLGDDSGVDHLHGKPLFELTVRKGYDRVVLVHLENLLVDREGVIKSLALHHREGFDITFSGERLPGANWSIINREILEGLQKNHPDIMSIEGGLGWAVRKPVYPFNTGIFHNPRYSAQLKADLRLRTARVAKTLAESKDSSFCSREFSYAEWLTKSGWERIFTDFAPLLLHLEPTNDCHGSCVSCPHGMMQREKSFLDPAIFFSAADDLRKVAPVTVIFSGMGEPFCHPEFSSMVAAVSDVHTAIFTSASQMPPDEFDISAPDLIRVSVDALSEEEFRIIRPGCSWKNFQELVRRLILAKNDEPELIAETGVSFVKFDLNNETTIPFIKHWRQFCSPVFEDQFFVWPPETKPEKIGWFQILGFSTYASAVENRSKISYTPLKRRVCPHAVTTLSILSDGRATICPFDYEGRWVLGDLKTSLPREIWESKAADRFRKAHLLQEFPPDLPCEKCSDWYRTL